LHRETLGCEQRGGPVADTCTVPYEEDDAWLGFLGGNRRRDACLSDQKRDDLRDDYLHSVHA
jgi:hypothetical protein